MSITTSPNASSPRLRVNRNSAYFKLIARRAREEITNNVINNITKRPPLRVSAPPRDPQLRLFQQAKGNMQ